VIRQRRHLRSKLIPSLCHLLNYVPNRIHSISEHTARQQCHNTHVYFLYHRNRIEITIPERNHRNHRPIERRYICLHPAFTIDMKRHYPGDNTRIRLNLNLVHVVEKAAAYVRYVDNRDDQFEE